MKILDIVLKSLTNLFVRFGRPDWRSGAEGARTPDLFAASEALFQLSYSPVRGRSLASGSLLFRTGFLVYVEDQVVGSVVADLEVEVGELFQFAQQIGWFV